MVAPTTRDVENSLEILKNLSIFSEKRVDQMQDDKFFQYAATIALNYDESKWNPKRVSNIKPFINK